MAWHRFSRLGCFAKWRAEWPGGLREDCDHVTRCLELFVVAPELNAVSIEDRFALPEARVACVNPVPRDGRADECIGRNVSRAGTEADCVALFGRTTRQQIGRRHTAGKVEIARLLIDRGI